MRVGVAREGAGGVVDTVCQVDFVREERGLGRGEGEDGRLVEVVSAWLAVGGGKERTVSASRSRTLIPAVLVMILST